MQILHYKNLATPRLVLPGRKVQRDLESPVEEMVSELRFEEPAVIWVWICSQVKKGFQIKAEF